jgi:hypothetical protein
VASPSPLPRRWLLWLALVGLLAVVAVLWWQDPTGSTPGYWNQDQQAELPAAGSLDQGLVASPLEPESGPNREVNRQEDPSHAQVEAPQAEIRVWVTTSDEEERDSPPPRPEQWTAVAQTWLEKTGETERIELPFNQHGLATFRFAEDTHVDWFAAVPPESSAYGFERVEDHLDYIVGEAEEVFVRVGFGGMLQGKVVDTAGKPLANVPVHLMHDEGAQLQFTPGYLQTTTNEAGKFVFGRLTEGNVWTVAVPPGEWLMVNPTFDELDYGAGVAEVSADPLPSDVGTLVVMRGEMVDLQVVDSLGQGVPGVYVEVVPQRYFDPQYRTPDPEYYGWAEAEEEEEELFEDLARKQFLSGQQLAQAEDLYDDYEEEDDQLQEAPYADSYGFTTGRDGHVDCPLVPGQYEAILDDYPGQYQLPESQHQPLRFTFSTEQDSVSIALPTTLGEIRGRVLDQDDRAVAYATVNVYNDYQDLYLMTDADGRFVAANLSMQAPCYLEIWDTLNYDRTFAAASWELFPSTTGEEHVLQVQDAFDCFLYVRAVGKGSIPPEGRLRLLNWTPNERTPVAVDPNWLTKVTTEIQLGREAFAAFGGFLPGNIEIGLFLPDPNAGLDARGRPQKSFIEFQRWNLEVSGASHTLRVDLSGYQLPQPKQTNYRVQITNAVTGRDSIVGALHAKLENPRTTHATQSDTGLFSFTTRQDRVLVTILARGYRPYREWWPATTEAEVERTIALTPEDSRLYLELVDRNGVTIPDCEVAMFAADGTTPQLADSEINASYATLRSTAMLQNGRLTLRMVPPGRLLLRPNLFGYQGTSAWVEVPQAPAGVSMTVTLDKTLEEIRQEILFLEQEG